MTTSTHIVNVKGSLKNFHFSFDPNELQLLCWSVTVVEEELLAWMNKALGKDSNAVIAVDHYHFRVAVGIDRMVGEADFVPFARGVDHKIIVQVEEEAAGVFVVDFSSSIGLVLGDYFTAVFLYKKCEYKRSTMNETKETYADEFVLLSSILEEDAPAGYIAWGHQQMLSQSTLHANVLACHLGQLELVSAALAQVWIAFSNC